MSTDDDEPALPRDDEYRVGNKRPPLHSRFQAGASGNSKGRPRGAVGLKTKIQQELRKSVPVNVNGRRKKMSKADVIAAQFVDSSMRGDPKATALILRITDDEGVKNSSEATALSEMRIDKETLKVIQARLQRHIDDDDEA